jgi:hypothetical protein
MTGPFTRRTVGGFRGVSLFCPNQNILQHQGDVERLQLTLVMARDTFRHTHWRPMAPSAFGPPPWALLQFLR